jgi:hypothetical protein
VGPERGAGAGGNGNVDVGVREVMPEKLRQDRDRTHVRVQNPAKRRKRPRQAIFSLPRMGAGRGGILCANHLRIPQRPGKNPKRNFLLTAVRPQIFCSHLSSSAFASVLWVWVKQEGKEEQQTF